MSHKTLFAFALVGALSCMAQPGIAQNSSSAHGGQWPIQNGIKHQPTRNELRALHDQDVPPSDAREIDRLYDELMSNSFSATHHTGNARMR
jgi:Spy/CpxP family protein refolding chaperone